MGSLTIRQLDDDLKRELRLRAAQHGRSMEEEARVILAAAIRPAKTKYRNAAEAVEAIIDPIGGIELDLPPRGLAREPPRFDWDDEDR